MSTMEIVLDMLTEATTTELSKATSRIITSQNAAQLNDVVTGMIEGVVDVENNDDKKK